MHACISVAAKFEVKANYFIYSEESILNIVNFRRKKTGKLRLLSRQPSRLLILKCLANTHGNKEYLVHDELICNIASGSPTIHYYRTENYAHVRFMLFIFANRIASSFDCKYIAINMPFLFQLFVYNRNK